MSYNVIKALHVISVIAWFAGLFYIFRLFVYHVKYRERPGLPEVYVEMEMKLLRYIMFPAMVLSLTFGAIMLVQQPALLRVPWMHFKLGCVLLLLVYHGFSQHVHNRLARGEYMLSERACRWWNEAPTVLLVGIVVAVIVRPW